MSTIKFETGLFSIGSWTILLLPEAASKQLPSRGQTMVQGTINGAPFKTPLEPDGRWSHWLHVDEKLLKAVEASSGDTVKVMLEPIKEWPEPEVPAVWQKALANSEKANAVWQSTTPMARWEWIRWARATNNVETFEKRIKVGISKLESGERRPCCWNRNACSEPSVSKSGVLLEPAVIQ
jgi:hypothetical protein